MGTTFTLWVLLHGFADVAGMIPSVGTAQLQPIGIYATFEDCEKVGADATLTFRKEKADVLWACLPTGIRSLRR